MRQCATCRTNEGPLHPRLKASIHPAVFGKPEVLLLLLGSWDDSGSCLRMARGFPVEVPGVQVPGILESPLSLVCDTLGSFPELCQW